MMEVSKEKKYVSVIKINGKSILPPLITPDLRKQLQKDKNQAIKLEQRLKKCRELRELLESHRPCSKLTFDDDSHIDALEIDKRINLSKDLIDVCQYNDNGLTVVEGGTYTTNSPNASYRARSASVPRREEIMETSTPKPRLIRSNSYTLESPSPIVLELMKKTHDSGDFSSINTVIYKGDSPDTSSKDVNEVKSPTIEVYQTDISVQQITVNSNSAQSKKEMFFTKNPFDSLEPDSELLNLLKEIPEEYSSQIIQLLEKQRIEQKDRLERYDNLKSNSEINFKSPLKNDLIDLTSFSEPILTRPHTSESTLSKGSTDTLKKSSTFSMSPSQSLYYSMTTDAHITPTSFEENGMEPLELGVLKEKNGYWEGVLKHDGKNGNDCSRELFPELDPITIKAAKRKWAAKIITAYVKGYLTRRLFRTERVQNVISTVKDVLMCALELHHSENIDEKDVELHRRLINQLSAALCTFHEIFFDLSIPERMMIISTDRQRKLEKMNNPLSGRSTEGSKSFSSSRPSSSRRRISESPSFTKV